MKIRIAEHVNVEALCPWFSRGKVYEVVSLHPFNSALVWVLDDDGARCLVNPYCSENCGHVRIEGGWEIVEE